MAEKLTIGQAIDQVLSALEPLEPASRRTVMAAVSAHLGLEVSTPSSSVQAPRGDPTPTSAGSASAAPPPPQRALTDIRSLKEQKAPKSARQMACVVAYYLAELAGDEEKKEAVTKADLEKYFKQAGFPLPEKIRDVLPDAKKGGYFDSVSRGAYKLNAVGYNLVAHKLPEGRE